MTVPDPTLCKYCQDIERKKRRFDKTRSDYNRWIVERDRQASAAKALDDMRLLRAEIDRLQASRAEKYMDLGSRRRAGA